MPGWLFCIVHLPMSYAYEYAYATKMFEYMSAGIPVIASDFALWREIIDEYKCGLCVDPNDIEEIAGAIKWLLDNPQEAQSTGQNGQKAVKEKFNWAKQEQLLLNLYKSLAGNF